MTSGRDAHGGTPAGTWQRQWLPLLVSGVIITGAAPLSTWCTGLTLDWHASGATRPEDPAAD